jgi:hypothetical protein
MLDAAELALPKLVSLQEEMGKILSGGSSGGLSGLLGKASGVKLPSIESIGADVTSALGSPTGFDPGSAIPNIKFKTEPTFDEDGEVNGEQLVAIKFGIPAISPVVDALEDAVPDPVVLKPVAATLKNLFLADTGMLATLRRSLPTVFDGPVTTEVVADPATGENIVYETQVDDDGEPVMVPSGFATQAEFEASYKQGREAAVGHMQKVLGTLPTFVGENTSTFQNLAGSLSKIVTSAALPTKAPGKPINRGIDPVTGVPVDQANLLNSVMNMAAAAQKAKPGIDAELKKLDKKTTAFFDRLGAPLPPGSEPASFNEEDTEL